MSRSGSTGRVLMVGMRLSLLAGAQLMRARLLASLTGGLFV